MQQSDLHKTDERVRFVARHYQPDRIDSRKVWPEMCEQLGIFSKHRPNHRTFSTYWQVAAAAALLLIAGILYFMGDKTEVLVAENERSAFSLPDQTKIVMQRGAKLEYDPRFGKNERHVSMSGEITFAVTRDETKPFIVSTPVARVEVLGTEFTVKADNKEARLTVTSGKVLFTPHDPVIPLLCDAGMAVHYRADTETVEVTSPESRIAINGKEDFLLFDNIQLKEVARVLSHYYNVSIELPDNESDIRFSSSFTRKSILEIINIINLTLDTHITLSY
ncbi:MAG: FecR family protein [Bacteroidales bacterium]|nr:FecR family protein [Bacteroidales bacterium]